MHGSRLDSLARELATDEISRRRALKLALGATLTAPAWTWPAAASATVHCKPGHVACNGKCCRPGEHCVKPKGKQKPHCQCPSHKTSCPKGCFDLKTDPHNCGSCGHACPSGQTCSNGTCKSSTSQCPPGQTSCNGTCVDLKSNVSNCGTCGHSCGQSASGHACIAGACGCHATSDCPAGSTCNTQTNLCVHPSGGGPGESCNASGDCASGLCLGGYCCEGPCNGASGCTAKTCTTTGACVFTDALGASACSAHSVCGADQVTILAYQCNQSTGACEQYTSGSCASEYIKCAPFPSNPNGVWCPDICSSDSDCVQGRTCRNNCCGPIYGEACPLGHCCGGANCVQGTCCSSTNGPCDPANPLSCCSGGTCTAQFGGHYCQ